MRRGVENAPVGIYCDAQFPICALRAATSLFCAGDGAVMPTLATNASHSVNANRLPDITMRTCVACPHAGERAWVAQTTASVQ
jgi:hypothetical protein